MISGSAGIYADLRNLQKRRNHQILRTERENEKKKRKGKKINSLTTNLNIDNECRSIHFRLYSFKNNLNAVEENIYLQDDQLRLTHSFVQFYKR